MARDRYDFSWRIAASLGLLGEFLYYDGESHWWYQPDGTALTYEQLLIVGEAIDASIIYHKGER